YRGQPGRGLRGAFRRSGPERLDRGGAVRAGGRRMSRGGAAAGRARGLATGGGAKLIQGSAVPRGGRPFGSNDLATIRRPPQGTLRSKPLWGPPPVGARRSRADGLDPLSRQDASH